LNINAAIAFFHPPPCFHSPEEALVVAGGFFFFIRLARIFDFRNFDRAAPAVCPLRRIAEILHVMRRVQNDRNDFVPAKSQESVVMIPVVLQRLRLLYVRLVVFGMMVVILEHSQNVINLHALYESDRFPMMNQSVRAANLVASAKRLPFFYSSSAGTQRFVCRSPLVFGKRVRPEEGRATFQLGCIS